MLEAWDGEPETFFADSIFAESARVRSLADLKDAVENDARRYGFYNLIQSVYARRGDLRDAAVVLAAYHTGTREHNSSSDIETLAAANDRVIQRIVGTISRLTREIVALPDERTARSVGAQHGYGLLIWSENSLAPRPASQSLRARLQRDAADRIDAS
jgi:hypothetical protein